jgi:hypothetical protein
MTKLLSIVLVAAALASPHRVSAQSKQASDSVPLRASAKVAQLPRQKKSMLRHPTAAERGLAPSDLVVVPGPKGEKRYARRRSVGR